jgi:hypothetical protein
MYVLLLSNVQRPGPKVCSYQSLPVPYFSERFEDKVFHLHCAARYPLYLIRLASLILVNNSFEADDKVEHDEIVIFMVKDSTIIVYSALFIIYVKTRYSIYPFRTVSFIPHNM